MTQPVDAWITALHPVFADASGDVFPPRPTVKVLGATITDDPTNNQTILDATSDATGGDLSGPVSNASVRKWYGVALDATTMSAPSNLQIPQFDNVSGKWKAVTLSLTAAGDVTGALGALTVVKIQGASVSAPTTAGTILQATSPTALAWVDPTTTLPFPNIQTHKVKWLNGETAAYNTTIPTAGLHYAGWSTLQFNGTTTTPTLSTSTRLGATKRLRFQTTTTTAYVGFYESGYISAGVAQWGSWRGNAANRGGFLMRARFAITNIGVSSTIHCFIGLVEAIGQAGSTFDYTTDTTTCKLGVGFTCATTSGSAFPSQNWQAIESAHSTPHLTDLGSGFALTLNDFIEVIMSASPDDTKVTLTLNNLTSGATTTVTLNTNLPTNTVMMGLQVAFGVQALSSGTDALDVALVYLEDFDG